MISKKYFALFLLLFFSAGKMHAQDGMKFFEGTWAEVVAEAKKQKKPIFMDAYTTWCGPCKRMAANVFPKPEVGEFYNKNFVNYKLDMEKGEGPELAKKHHVSFYPTYLFFTSEGELMHRAMGSKGPEDFINDGKVAIDPNQNLYGQIARFQKGDRDSAFIQNLLTRLQDLDATMQKDVLDTYWKGKKMDELYEPANWAVFTEYENDLLSDRFKYVLDNRKSFADKFGKKEIDGALINKAGPQMQSALGALNEPLYNRIHEVLSISDNKEIKKFTANSEVLFLLLTKNMKKFNVQAPLYVKQYISGSADDLHQLAFAIYQNSEDKDALKNAEIWAKKSVDIKKDHANMGTYAAILNKNKKHKEAEAAATESLNMAKAAGADPTPATQLLEMIRSEKK